MSSVTREALLSGEKRFQAVLAIHNLFLLFNRTPTITSDQGGKEIGRVIDLISGLTVEAIEERNARHYGGREEGS